MDLWAGDAEGEELSRRLTIRAILLLSAMLPPAGSAQLPPADAPLTASTSIIAAAAPLSADTPRQPADASSTNPRFFSRESELDWLRWCG